MNSIGRFIAVAMLSGVFVLGACGDDTSPGGDLGNKIDQKVNTPDGGAKDVGVGNDATAKQDVGVTPDLPVTGPDATAQSCTTCHGTPPNSGQHSRHVNKVSMKCAACHSEVVDDSMKIIDATLHQNGTKNVKANGTSAKFTWSGSSCTGNGCHGTKNW